MRILFEEFLKSFTVFLYLRKCWGVDAGSLTVRFLGQGRGFAHHHASNLVDFHKRNVIELAYVFDERTELECVEVADGNDGCLAPVLGKLCLKLHRELNIKVNIWIAFAVLGQEPLEL